MNRKVTRDEVIILMFFKSTWDSPRWFRPAVQPEHPFVGMGAQPTPAGSKESSLWHQKGLGGFPWMAPRTLVWHARDSPCGCSWLSGCCPCSACDTLAVPAWRHWGTPHPVVISQIICVHIKWWPGTKCPPNTLRHSQHQSKFIIWLKNNPRAPWTHGNDGFKLLFAIYIFFKKKKLEIPVLLPHLWEKFNLLCATVRSNQQVCCERQITFCDKSITGSTGEIKPKSNKNQVPILP